MSAHPDDILVVCWSEERRLYRQFENRQVIVVRGPEQLYGRKFRTAWVTSAAIASTNTRFWDTLHREAFFNDADIRNIDEYEEGA